MIWEMTVSIWSSWISILDVLSLSCLQVPEFLRHALQLVVAEVQLRQFGDPPELQRRKLNSKARFESVPSYCAYKR
jgi:hypothetical protein